MAITKPTNTDLIRPLEGAVIRRFTVGTGGVTAGDIVSGSTDGVITCDGNGVAAKVPVGMAMKTASAGEVVAVVTHGAVGGFTSTTLGAEIYPSDATPGLPSETASTNKYSVGVSLSASIVFVRVTYVA